MSLFNALYTGSNGLEAHSDALSVVGDDIANASTVGYESTRAQFEDMIGGTAENGINVGDGSRMSGPETLFAQGSIESTGQPTDMALQGNGFFVVNGSVNGVDGSYYTRDGQFSLDNSGTLVNESGMDVQGYMIDATGKVAQSATNLKIGGQSAPNPTTKLSMSVNLNSTETAVGPFDPANPAATSNYQTSTTVYDSLGNGHRADVYFTQGTGGNWTWNAQVDGGDVTGGTAGTPVTIASGTATFNTDGSLQAQSTTSSSASFVGADANQKIAFNFGDDIASGGTGLAGSTQYAQASSVNATSQDGYAAGSLSSVSVGADGTITGTFSNGQTRAVAQVAVATFASNTGLQRENSQLFQATQSSGPALVDKAEAGGRASVLGGSLESSTVDLSNELVTMIAYQRAYSANSKVIQTADQMLQELDTLNQ